jgi:hypothetical protein
LGILSFGDYIVNSKSTTNAVTNINYNQGEQLTYLQVAYTPDCKSCNIFILWEVGWCRAVGMTNPIHEYTFININSYRVQQRGDQ